MLYVARGVMINPSGRWYHLRLLGRGSMLIITPIIPARNSVMNAITSPIMPTAVDNSLICCTVYRGMIIPAVIVLIHHCGMSSQAASRLVITSADMVSGASRSFV